VGQLGSVIRGGLAARAREALTQPAAQIGVDALAWAVVIAVVKALVQVLGFKLRFGGSASFPSGTFLTFVLPALVVVLFTGRRTRTSGLVGLVWLVLGAVERTRGTPPGFYAQVALPLAGFALLAFAPRRMSTSGRWLWVIPAAVLAYFEATQTGAPSTVGYIAPVLVALCLLPLKPAFALGTALTWSVPTALNFMLIGGVGRWTLLSIELVACLPLALIATGIGRLLVRRA
jgi:hypothetical protein